MEERANRPAYNAIEIAKTVGEDGAEKTTIALQNPRAAPLCTSTPKRSP